MKVYMNHECRMDVLHSKRNEVSSSLQFFSETTYKFQITENMIMEMIDISLSIKIFICTSLKKVTNSYVKLEGNAQLLNTYLIVHFLRSILKIIPFCNFMESRNQNSTHRARVWFDLNLRDKFWFILSRFLLLYTFSILPQYDNLNVLW